jgi:mono/diheme cytochrome c family protein
MALGSARSRTVGVAALLGLCLAGCVQGLRSTALDQPTTLPSAARGAVFARQNCGGCHAVEGTGPSPDRRAPSFRTLAGHYVGSSLQRKLTEIAETGHYDMPPLLVHSDDVDDVAAYLEELNRP